VKLADRVQHFIKRLPGNVIIRSEITMLGSATQLTDALNTLIKKGIIVRIGLGIYAKTRKSSVTGAQVPAGSLETLATEALGKMGILFSVGRAAAAYNSGATTQLPGSFAVHTGNRKISRKIEVGGRRLVYETMAELFVGLPTLSGPPLRARSPSNAATGADQYRLPLA